MLNMCLPRSPRYRCAAGFSLIEVLSALVILSVGLLGIAAMVSASLRSNDNSYQRTQAMALSSGILDRMRANRATANAGGYDIAFGALPSAPPLGDCTGSAANCTPAQVANLDLTSWKTDLAKLLPSGDGRIMTHTVDHTTQVTISIAWNGQRPVRAAEAAATRAAPSSTSLTVTSGL